VHIASNCDGAIRLDYLGFSASEAEIGHKIAAKIHARMPLTIQEKDWIPGVIHNHRKQLVTNFGYQLAPLMRVIESRDLNRLPEVVPNGRIIPYLRYSEDTTQVSVQLPPVPKPLVRTIVGELLKIENDCRFTFNPDAISDKNRAESPIKRIYDDTWEKGATISFYLEIASAKELLDKFEDLGCLSDQRISERLADPHKAYLDILTDEPRLRIRIKPFDFNQERTEALHDIYHSVGWKNYPFEKKTRSFVGYLGDKLLFDYQGFIERFNIGNREALIEAIMDPSVREGQVRSLVDDGAFDDFVDAYGLRGAASDQYGFGIS
jgi:hypothetical protein